MNKITLSITSLIILYFLFSQNHIYTFLISHSGSGGFFSDWEFIVQGLECKSNLQKCDFSYGGIFLLLPYTNEFNFFYYKVIPILFIILFVFYVVKIIDLKKPKYIFLTLLLIFNPSTLLALERANTDILFFIILLTICYSRIYFLNFILINFSFLAKYYPITFFINYFIEKKDRSNIKSLSLVFLSILFCWAFISFDQDGLKGLLGKPGETYFRIGAGWEYYFSIKAIPRVVRYIFDYNYIFVLFIWYSFFIFLIIKLYKYFEKLKIFKNLSLDRIEDKIFILGINTLFLCFILFSNWYYREIYLIASLPLLIRLKDERKLKQINYIFTFIVLRYFFLFIYSYILLQGTHHYIDGQRIFYNSFLFLATIKGAIDFILMSILSSFLVFYNFEIIKKMKFKDLIKMKF